MSRRARPGRSVAIGLIFVLVGIGVLIPATVGALSQAMEGCGRTFPSRECRPYGAGIAVGALASLIGVIALVRGVLRSEAGP